MTKLQICNGEYFFSETSFYADTFQNSFMSFCHIDQSVKNK